MRLTVVTEDEAVVNVDVRLLSCCACRGGLRKSYCFCNPQTPCSALGWHQSPDSLTDA